MWSYRSDLNPWIRLHKWNKCLNTERLICAIWDFRIQLVTNLEVLAGRLKGAAITGCVEGRVRCQTPWISQSEAKTLDLSASTAFSGRADSAALWGSLPAGGWTGQDSRGGGAAAGPRPFGRGAEVKLYCDYNDGGGTRAEGWWWFSGPVGWRGWSRCEEQQ